MCGIRRVAMIGLACASFATACMPVRVWRGDPKPNIDLPESGQTLRLELPLASGLLAVALGAVAGLARTAFRLSFTRKDPQALKALGLAAATGNARLAAEAMAAAAGVTLGLLLSIRHSSGEGQEEGPILCAPCVGGVATFEEVEPEDIKAEDSVTCVWALG